MQSGDRRCRHRIGRWAWDRCVRSVSGSDQGCRHDGPPAAPSADTCGGEQLATAEFKVEFGIPCGHGDEVAPWWLTGTAYRNLMTVREWRDELQAQMPSRPKTKKALKEANVAPIDGEST